MKRRTRILIFAAALLTPSIGMGSWYGVVKVLEQNDEFSGLVSDSGYLELTPPSRLFGPGTLATVEKLRSGALKLHPACEMSEGDLSRLWQKSTTLDRTMVTTIQNKFLSEANVLSAASAHATGERIRDVNVSLLDTNIVTMSYENLIRVRNQYVTGTCEEAVAWNLRAGATVCQTEEVLQADVIYTFGFKVGLGSDAKLESAKEFAGSIKIDGLAITSNDVRGNDLYVGVNVRFAHCFKFADSGNIQVARL